MKKQLPKFYVIKRDESNPLWKKYEKWTKDNGLDTIFIWDYIGFDGSNCNNGFLGSNKIEYFKNNPELITLEYWDECVNGRKIIGYKAPFDLFSGDVKKDSLYVGKIDENGYSRKGFEDDAVYYLPKEIVETWEAVYEEDKLEVVHWYNDSITSQINFKGLLTKEKVDKIKEVINE